MIIDQSMEKQSFLENLLNYFIFIATHQPARSPARAAAAPRPGALQCSPRPANCQSEPEDRSGDQGDHLGSVETHFDILPRPRDHLSKQLGVVSVQGRLSSLAPCIT